LKRTSQGRILGGGYVLDPKDIGAVDVDAGSLLWKCYAQSP